MRGIIYIFSIKWNIDIDICLVNYFYINVVDMVVIYVVLYNFFFLIVDVFN